MQIRNSVLMAWVACSGLAFARPCLADDAGDEVITRYRPVDRPQVNAALDGMEGHAPPPLAGPEWMNSPGLSWEALAGRVVLVDFWGVWCGPCRAMIPDLKALQRKYEEDGLTVIGIHTREAWKRGTVYVEEEEIPYPVLFDTDDRMSEAFHVASYPALFLIDHRGVLRYADVDGSDKETAVQRLLAERAADSVKGDAGNGLEVENE